MDFSILYAIIKKNYKFITIFTIIIILVVLAFSFANSGGYDVSLSLFVFSRINQTTPDEQSDEYFSIKAADQFADTVSQWTKSPVILGEIYKQAGPDQSVQKSFFSTSGIKAKKMAAQYVEINFRVADLAQAGKIAKAITTVLQGKAELTNKYSGNAVFSIVGNDPVVTRNKANYILLGFLALVCGFLLAIFFVLLKQPNQNDRRD